MGALSFIAPIYVIVMAKVNSPIGIFDSGYGGLTIMREIVKRLPQYDYLYLGDNARAPYGNRSFELVYRFTLEAVTYLFNQGCELVILACNTASAKALRTIQQCDLPRIDASKRVLGVIRPTIEAIGSISHTGHVGVLATTGTIASESYTLEAEKLYPDFHIFGQACPMWVPLVENKEYDSPGADYFIDKYIEQLLAQSIDIDTVILGCTHYPLLLEKIRSRMPERVALLEQGGIVAASLDDYLLRHPEMKSRISTSGIRKYLTTENPEKFNDMASIFMGEKIKASHIEL